MNVYHRYFLNFLFLFLSIQGIGQTVQAQLDLLDSLGEFHFYQGNLDSSVAYFEKIVPLAGQQKDVASQLQAYNWLFYLHIAQGQQDSLAAYLQRMLSLAKTLQPISGDNAAILSSLWNNKSYYHDLREEFYEKIESDRNALKYYELSEDMDSSEVAVLYQNLGTSLAQLGDYFQAKVYSKKALQLLRPSESRTNIQLDSLKILISIGKQSSLLGNYNEAEYFLSAAESIASGFKPTDTKDMLYTKALSYLHRGANYYMQDNNPAATDAFNKSNYFLKLFGEVNDLSPMLFRFMARNKLAQNQFDEAENWARTALGLIDKQFSDRVNQYIETQEILGDIYARQGDHQAALSAYQKTLHQLCPAFTSMEFVQNPSPDQFIHTKNKLLRVLRKKADVLAATNKTKAALQTYQLAIDLFHDMREDYLTEDARLFLSEQMIPLFEEAIKAAILLEQPELAFQFVEQSKALSLYEALKEKEAYELANIPDSLSENLRQLKIKHVHWEKVLFEKQLENEEASMQQAKNQLFAIKREQDLLRDELRLQYPSFFDLKFEKDSISIANIRNQILGPTSALIEYFVTEHNIFLFGITQKEFKVKTIKRDSLFNEQINVILQAIHQGPSIAPNLFAQAAHAFFQTYLNPILESFQSAPSELYIVPDERLNYLPFEVLLTEPINNRPGAYSTYPYLVKQFTCSYAYSSNLLLKASGSHPASGGSFVGFAPTLNRADLPELGFSVEAVEAIRQLTHGISYLNQNATKANLLAPTKAPSILHLSTHAKMDDQHPMGSKIFLADGDLATKEIYTFPYRTQMVVLSACETGSGKLYNGEGIMSLARAFMQSGSPSVITSLWKVDDKSTSELMLSFYEHLGTGLSKHNALQQAKLDFLASKESESLHHPYYWAAFIHIGNTELIQFPQGKSTLLYLGFLAVALLLLAAVYSARKG